MRARKQGQQSRVAGSLGRAGGQAEPDSGPVRHTGFPFTFPLQCPCTNGVCLGGWRRERGEEGADEEADGGGKDAVIRAK